MENLSQASQSRPLVARVVLFAFCFVFWLALTWPFASGDGSLRLEDVAAGIVVAVVVALVMREMIRVNFGRLLDLRCWFWLFVYLFVFAYYVVKGGIDVAYRVLHPAMPIKPGIVRARSVLKTDTGLTVLANSITLTPGTLTIDVSDDGVFYVHWLNVLTEDDEAAAKQLLRRFEWFIQRIFEHGVGP
jgi:multicomponent Na+:H+ antiporter subunit E